MPNVQAPDGTVVNFDDNMAPDAIAAVMRQHFPPGGSGHADPSFWSDLKAGANTGMTALGSAAQGVGSVLHDTGLPGQDTANAVGSWLKNNAPAVPAGYHSRGGDILHDVGQGNYMQAAGDVAHGLVEGAPIAGAAIGGGALADAVGLPAMAGAGLVGGTLGLGTSAGTRAAKAGRSVPSTADMAASLPRAGADAVLSGAGLGPIASRAGGVIGRAVRNTLASGAQSGVDQLDTTGTVDPTQVGNAAVLGGAGALATEVPGAARNAIQGGVNRALTTAPATAAEAQSQADVGRLYDETLAQLKNTRGADTRPTAVMNAVKSQLEARTKTLAAQLREDGTLTPPLKSMFDASFDMATHGNNELVESGGVGIPTVFDDLTAAAQQEPRIAPLVQALRTMNVASGQSFLKNQSGPFRSALGAVGATAGGAASIPMTLGLGAHMMAQGGRAVGGAIGGMADNVFGLSLPPMVRQSLRANQFLRANNLTPNASTLGMLRDAAAGSDQTSTGAPPATPPGMTPAPSGFIQRSPTSAPAAPALPSSLTINTPADVRQSIATDSMAQRQLPAGLQATPAPAATPQPGTAPAAPTASPGASTGAFQTPGAKFIAARIPGVTTHAQAVAAAQAAEDAGAVSKGTAAMVNTSPANIDPRIAATIQQHALDQQRAAVGLPDTASSGVRNPLSYAANLRQEQGAYDSVPADLKQIADTLRNPELNHKTKAGRRALLDLAKSLHANPARLEQTLGPLTGYGQD